MILEAQNACVRVIRKILLEKLQCYFDSVPLCMPLRVTDSVQKQVSQKVKLDRVLSVYLGFPPIKPSSITKMFLEYTSFQNIINTQG